jgi:hypothetical protein
MCSFMHREPAHLRHFSKLSTNQSTDSWTAAKHERSYKWRALVKGRKLEIGQALEQLCIARRLLVLSVRTLRIKLLIQLSMNYYLK